MNGFTHTCLTSGELNAGDFNSLSLLMDRKDLFGAQGFNF